MKEEREEQIETDPNRALNMILCPYNGVSSRPTTNRRSADSLSSDNLCKSSRSRGTPENLSDKLWFPEFVVRLTIESEFWHFFWNRF